MEKNNIYFVGAGGIGMAALERYFLANGCRVAGYDRTPSELTDDLRAEGVEITFTDDEAEIPAQFRDPASTLVVYTPAVPADSRILSYFRDNGFEVVKRARLLGEVTRQSKSLCFAGTHGKTTTSSMAAHILQTQGTGCDAFLGGVLRNYGTNFLLSASSPFSVIEADEYDRSFHQLTPYIAVVTSTDPDHLDIYGDEEGYLEGFARFTELVRPDGALLLHKDLKLKPRPAEGVRVFTYSKDEGDFHASYIRRGHGVITFDFVFPGGKVRDISLGVPVEVNIENAVAALAAVWLTGQFDAVKAREAIASFQGAKRRFEFWLREEGPEGRVIIDDYAHHPDELEASISSVKALYPGREITVAFQPHLYTRTRDFADGFARALSLADRVWLLPIYPAREEPIPGVDSEMILSGVTCENKELIPYDGLINKIKSANFDILLTAGAGDIANLLPGIAAAAAETAKKN
ncbi:MAG: UDP-N-acetylmuramate--L-alanine ligase [[Clostridium] fimetarium]|nr:UDP-N-acetylmuramate--L-alanine ligase [Alistipes timonensis]MCM1406738.1 UDP-N-acetylmuramate--L-alanine ligase [[Clostridium] fimetarium]